MRIFLIWHVLIGIFLFGIWSCSSAPKTVSPYYETPPNHILKGGREIFARALKQQKNNKMESSIDLWKRYLGNNPRSFKGYNNLGMAHYSNDQLSKALFVFETGLALEPQDPKINQRVYTAIPDRKAIMFQFLDAKQLRYPVSYLECGQ